MKTIGSCLSLCLSLLLGGVLIYGDTSLASQGAVSLRPFGPESLKDVTSTKVRQPFMMVLWSIDCSSCLKELALFREYQKQLTHERLVLIATDGPDAANLVEQTLVEYQLDHLDNWLFSEDMVEHIRFSIDPEWYGELPRTYFYGDDGSREAHSGLLTEALLVQWLQFTRDNSPKGLNE